MGTEGQAMLRYLLARFRLSQRAICEESAGRGLGDDFHDYPDTADGQPWHLVDLTCRHCGKTFRI
ncbi:hypothetical protein DK412_28365 [Methylobacterium sp. 17Sr1-1]|nr:hypothetical protein DK412_28365 [Methylobacterium sp. 17Sr1-1]